MAREPLQKIADFYAEKGGAQTLLSVYRDEALLFLQASAGTVDKLARVFKGKSWPYCNDVCWSGDGSTWVIWWLRLEMRTSGEWLPWLATKVSALLKAKAPILLDDDSLNYIDNRDKDDDTVSHFANLLP